MVSSPRSSNSIAPTRSRAASAPNWCDCGPFSSPFRRIARASRRALFRHQSIRGDRDRRNGPATAETTRASRLRHHPLPRFRAAAAWKRLVRRTGFSPGRGHRQRVPRPSGSSRESHRPRWPRAPPAGSASPSMNSNEPSITGSKTRAAGESEEIGDLTHSDHSE